MTHPGWQAVADLIDQDISLSQQFVSLLQGEREALDQRDYQRFQQLLAEKQPLLALLEQHSQQRKQQLQAMGLETEAATLELLQQQSPATADKWRQLEKLWLQCQQLNNDNQQAVQRTQKTVQQLLGILRGKDTSTQTYDQQGSTRNSGGGRSISNA